MKYAVALFLALTAYAQGPQPTLFYQGTPIVGGGCTPGAIIPVGYVTFSGQIITCQVTPITGIGTWTPYAINTQTLLSGPSVRYVSNTGTDLNDGTTWFAAKATVSAAIAALPNVGGSNYGTIMLGPGVFTESNTPLQWNVGIRLIGASNGGNGQSTTIKLANGKNTSLFSYTSAFGTANGYAHGLQMEHLILDCNAQNETGVSPCVKEYNGGYSNYSQSLTIQNCSGPCLEIDNAAVDFACYSCNFAQGYGASCIDFNDLSGGWVASLYDTQIDNCGTDIVYISQANSDTSSSNIFSFVNLKTEAFTAVTGTTGQHAIHFHPRTSLGNPVSINVMGMTSINTISTGTSALYEDNNGGIGANWQVSGFNGNGGYSPAFRSDATGFSSAAGEIRLLSASHTAARYAYVPEIELSSGFSLQMGTGSPNTVITANTGSMYINLSGGAGTTLYVKESGTGNTGWVGK